MNLRIIIAAVIVLCFGSFGWLRGLGIPTECAPIEMKLADLPMSLGEWNGEPRETDPEIFQALGAAMVIDRNYRDQHGKSIVLHSAVFDLRGKADCVGLTSPPFHQPEVCYTSTGWHIDNTKLVPVDRAKSFSNSAKLLTISRKDETSYVLYWYQLDGKPYCTGDSQRRLTLSIRGRSTRPPLVKVMLQTTAANADEAEKTLTSLAGEAFAWTKDFH